MADGWPEGTPRSSNKGTGVGGPRASGVVGDRRMSGVEGGSAGQGEGICAGGGAGGGSPRSRLRPPGGCKSRPRPREASRAVPRSSARWISLGVPELLPRSVGPGRRASSGSGLGRGGLPMAVVTRVRLRGYICRVSVLGSPQWPWNKNQVCFPLPSSSALCVEQLLPLCRTWNLPITHITLCQRERVWGKSGSS